MPRRITTLSAVLIGLLWAATVMAGTVSVDVRPKSVDLQGMVTVEFYLNSQGESFVPPDFHPDFRVISTRDMTFTSYSVTVINGRVTQTTSKRGRIQYILSPLRTGRLTIKAGRLMMRGRIVMRTTPVVVTVTGGGGPGARRPGPGTGPGPTPTPTPTPTPRPKTAPNPVDLNSLLGRPYFIHPRLSKRTLYLGDQVALHFDIYMTGLAYQLTPVNEPKFKDFHVEKLETGPRYWRRKYVRGVQYRVLTYKSVLLTPTKAGKLTIDSLGVRFYYDQAIRLNSKAFTIQVKPLPKKGRPEDFHWGNVARSPQISATIDPKRGAQNERFILTITLSGTGNVRHFKLDALKELKDFQYVNRGGKLRDFRIEGDRFVGTQVYTLTLVPTKAGKLTVPAISFSYFNPQTEKFEVAKTKPIPLLITASKEISGDPGKTVKPKKGLREIQLVSNIGGYRNRLFASTVLFKVLLVGPLAIYLVLLAVGFVMRRRQANPEKYRQKNALPAARTRMKEISKLGDRASPETFYSEMSRVLTTYLEDRLGEPVKGKTHLDLKIILELRGCMSATVDEVIMELENCDFGRFAPSKVRAEEMRQTFERIGQTLKKLEKELLVEGDPSRKGEPVATRV